jgi:hypothetical protein
MKFKAKIKYLIEDKIEIQIQDMAAHKIDKEFLFSKSKIYFPKHKANKHYVIMGCLEQVGRLSDGKKYMFDKIYDEDTEKTIFKISLEGSNGCGSELQIDLWNKLKCNIIHKRYWIDREKEWFLKTMIATAVGALFALMGAYVGYKIGIQSLKLPTTTVQPGTTQPTVR